MKQVIPVLFLSAFLFSCKPKEKEVYNAGDKKGIDTSMISIEDSVNVLDRLCQHWDNKEDAEDVVHVAGTMEIPIRGYYFFKDGSVVKDPKDHIAFGKWTLDKEKKLLDIVLDNNATEHLFINRIDCDQMLMSWAVQQNQPTVYKADCLIHHDVRNDPFCPANLQWRIKPEAPEDNAAIHKRIKQAIHFFYLWHIDLLKRNPEEVNFFGVPNCFKFYQGGIHLTKEEKLPDSWKNIFYDANDEGKAYVILDKMISKKFNWDKEEKHWLKQNADVLLQMEAKIDSL